MWEGFSADVTVKLSDPPADQITIPLEVYDRQARLVPGNDDYTFPQGIVFEEGQTTKTFTVEAHDDAVYEGRLLSSGAYVWNEVFYIGFGDLSNLPGWAVGKPDNVYVQIVEDDGIRVSFSQDNYETTEDGSPANITMRLTRRNRLGDDPFSPETDVEIFLKVASNLRGRDGGGLHFSGHSHVCSRRDNQDVYGGGSR